MDNDAPQPITPWRFGPENELDITWETGPHFVITPAVVPDVPVVPLPEPEAVSPEDLTWEELPEAVVEELPATPLPAGAPDEPVVTWDGPSYFKVTPGIDPAPTSVATPLPSSMLEELPPQQPMNYLVIPETPRPSSSLEAAREALEEAVDGEIVVGEVRMTSPIGYATVEEALEAGQEMLEAFDEVFGGADDEEPVRTIDRPVNRRQRRLEREMVFRGEVAPIDGASSVARSFVGKGKWCDNCQTYHAVGDPVRSKKPKHQGRVTR